MAASRPRCAAAQIRRLRASVSGTLPHHRPEQFSATVRGTDLDVTDRCDGTLTHVKRAAPSIVRDFRRKQNVILSRRQELPGARAALSGRDG